MGKKKSRAKYVSKGQRRSIVAGVGDFRDTLDKQADKFQAFLEGRKVFFTIDNPNPNETAKRKIRVEGKELYGDFRKARERHIIR